MAKPFWNAARAAQQRKPRRWSKVGPVGDDRDNTINDYHATATKLVRAEKPILGIDYGTKPPTVAFHQPPEQHPPASLRACLTCGWEPVLPHMYAMDCSNAACKLMPEHIAHRDARKQAPSYPGWDYNLGDESWVHRTGAWAALVDDTGKFWWALSVVSDVVPPPHWKDTLEEAMCAALNLEIHPHPECAGWFWKTDHATPVFLDARGAAAFALKAQ